MVLSQELAPLLQNGAAAISDDLLDSVHDILVSNTRFYQVHSSTIQLGIV